MSRPGIPVETGPDRSVKGFWRTSYIRLAYAVKMKTIGKALPRFKGETEEYGINRGRP
jgi:hypothetical protein